MHVSIFIQVQCCSKVAVTYLGKHFKSITKDFNTAIQFRVEVYHPSIVKSLKQKHLYVYKCPNIIWKDNLAEKKPCSANIIYFEIKRWKISTRRLYKLMSPSNWDRRCLNLMIGTFAVVMGNTLYRPLCVFNFFVIFSMQST